MMFDAFVMVDWSAATVPRTGRDSIWICWNDKGGERLENPPSRHAAKSILADWLAAAVPRRERGLVDLHTPSAQPCWKLLGTGSVGGQALTGIPVVRALRDDPRWIDRVRIWPFETGLQPPEQGAVVVAEVYPSLWAVSPAEGEPKDAAQVRSVARFFAESDRAGELAALFAGDPSLTPEQRFRVETEEAWTLGVTAARQRPIRLSRNAAEGAGGSQAGEASGVRAYAYIRDPDRVPRRSSALIRAEADSPRCRGNIETTQQRVQDAA